MPKLEWFNAAASAPQLGQLVMVCGRTHRHAPYQTFYKMARYVGGDQIYQFRAMDGLSVRDTVVYWRELTLYELPNEL